MCFAPNNFSQPSKRASLPVHDRFFACLPGLLVSGQDEHPAAGHTVSISLTESPGAALEVPGHGRLVNWFAAMPELFRSNSHLRVPKADYVRRVESCLIPADGLAVLIDTAQGWLIAHETECARLPIIGSVHRDPEGGVLDTQVNAAALRLAQSWAMARGKTHPSSDQVLLIKESVQVIANRLDRAMPGTPIAIIFHAAISSVQTALTDHAAKPTATLFEALNFAQRRATGLAAESAAPAVRSGGAA